MRKTTVQVIKWVLYAVLLYLVFGLQTTVTIHAVFDIRPVLLVAFVTALSMQEREVFALVFGLAAGFMWDFSAGTTPGFNAMILMVCCVVISLATMYYMGNNFLNAMLFCGITMLLQGLMDYFFYYVIWGYESHYLILVRYILPTVLYTVLVTPLFFFLLRWLHNKLESRMEQ